MDIKEVVQKIKDNEIEYFGIRTLAEDEDYKVGDECRESFEWDIENDCSTYDLDGEDGETADGTCVTMVFADCYDDADEIEKALETAIKANKGYGAATRAIIAGENVSTDGVFDENEGRLVDAYVLEIL